MLSESRRTDHGRPVPSRGQRVPLVLFSLLVAVGLVELLGRIFLDPPAAIRLTQDLEVMRGDPNLIPFSEILESDPELFWRMSPSQSLPDDAWPFPGLISNAAVLREPYEIPAQKPPKETRILFIGDSCTFGYGLRRQETFVARTESTLRRVLPSRSVECINAGVPGYSLFQGYQYLKTRGIDLRPDLVVASFGWNDMEEWDSRGDLDHYEILRNQQAPGILAWSLTARSLWRLVHSPPPPRAASRPRLLPGEFRTVLEKMHQICSDSGIDLMVVRWPFTVQLVDQTNTLTALQLQMRILSHEHSIEMIDLIPVFETLRESNTVESLFYDHGHATSLGNQWIAKEVSSHLGSWVAKRFPETAKP